MDRQEGDDELPGAPERMSADAGRPGCRRPLPARMHDWGGRLIGPRWGKL